jgi:hypothetical protein
MDHQLHHFYYGVALLILALILKKINAPEGLIYLVLVIGLGYICDKSGLLFSIGRTYSMALYGTPLNISMDIVLIVSLWRLSQQSSKYRYSMAYGSEINI